MFNKSIIFMVSLKKENREAERNILIEAGLITRHVENAWAHYYVHSNGTTELHLSSKYRTWCHYHVPLIITARDLVTLFSLKTLNPNIDALSMVKAIKMNARNKHLLNFSGVSLD